MAGPLDNAFPTPPRKDQKSASLSKASAQISPASAEIITLQRAASTPPERSSGHRSLRSKVRDNADKTQPRADVEAAWQQKELAKKLSYYFDATLALREPETSAKERIARDSPVVAEIEAHREFLADLSFQLSEIYQRPMSCIMVEVSTGVHIMMGGSSDPAYHLVLTTLPSGVSAIKNKRSAFLLQSFMSDTLHIPPSRGVVEFHSAAEENIATNGVTTLQEIQLLEKEASEEKDLTLGITRQAHRMRKKSSGTLGTGMGTTRTPAQEQASIPLGETSHNQREDELGPFGFTMSVRRKMKSRKSILAFFRMGRSEAG